MDPEANLKEQVQLAKRFLVANEDERDVYSIEDGVRLAELVLSLDEWRRQQKPA